MLKPTVLKVIIFLVLGGGFFFVASNAHFDPFPCTTASYDYRAERLEAPHDGTCSIMNVKRSGEPGADFAKLTPAGYALAGLLFVILPYLIAAGIGHAITRKRRSA